MSSELACGCQTLGASYKLALWKGIRMEIRKASLGVRALYLSLLVVLGLAGCAQALSHMDFWKVYA